MISKSGMYIAVKLNGINLEGLVDTGSDICVLKESFISLIKPDYISRNPRLSISGLGANVTTKGSCKIKVEIDGSVFENEEVHLVNSRYMRPDFIIGMNLLSSATVSIEGGRVSITKKRPAEREQPKEEPVKKGED